MPGTPGTATPQELIEAANAVFGRHPGHRALHAKGSWCAGRFTPAPEAGALCTAPHFAGTPSDALVRFSNASGDPEAHDADRDGRGMAVKLRPGTEGETDILATTSPTFLTRTPADFLEALRLRRPDPETGRPDLERLGAFLAAHPECQPAVLATVGSEPAASFAMLTYHSPHAFGLIDAGGETRWVRYRWRPEAGERRLGDEQARALGRDHLHEELAERLGAGEPIAFTLELRLAEPGDPLDDPTYVWPEEREVVVAGRLELTEPAADPEAGGGPVVFDPTRVAGGIELPDDPILHARPGAYSVSVERRAASR